MVTGVTFKRFGPWLLELPVMAFPRKRLRRLRRTETLRALVRETRLAPESLVYPLFIGPGTGVRNEVRSMPGVFNLSIDEAVKEVRQTRALGVLAIILFGLPEKKDEQASGAWADDGIVQRATRAIKSEVRDLVVISCCLVREQSSLKAFWYVAKNWRRVMAKRRDIMSRKRVDDEYIAHWFRYEPVSAPASKPKSSGRPLARSKAARG